MTSRATTNLNTCIPYTYPFEYTHPCEYDTHAAADSEQQALTTILAYTEHPPHTKKKQRDFIHYYKLLY